MKKVIIISKGDINQSPTINNYLSSFSSLGFDTHCICSISTGNANFEGVKIHEIGFGGSRNPLIKLRNYNRFGKAAIKTINQIGVDSETIIWIARIDTAICFGNRFKSYKSILSLHELHDEYPIWKYVTKRVISSYDTIVYNEINRANIARVWYKLSTTPLVIPNKPNTHPLKRNITLKDEKLQKTISEVKKEKKIILYQGSLLKDRNIDPLVKASSKFSDEYVLVLMGKDSDNRINDFRKINPDIVHIPWVTPPDHLYITSHAHIGVAFYDFDCLNSIYCAPNKIWEYSGFGIPMIGQNIPGLINTVEANRAGLCIDIDDENEIVSAINSINNNYQEYADNSSTFYNSVDFKAKVKHAIEDIN